MRAWLPRMGAPFAKAYRDIRKMPETAAGLQQAVARIHESLNKTAGTSLFGNNIDNFIQDKPKFSPVKLDIEKFFALSRKVFFEPESAQNSSEHTKAWLMKFCRHLRDCERGLRPEASA
jgi:mxaA protein